VSYEGGRHVLEFEGDKALVVFVGVAVADRLTIASAEDSFNKKKKLYADQFPYSN
jgi:hypothetical protein